LKKISPKKLLSHFLIIGILTGSIGTYVYAQAQNVTGQNFQVIFPADTSLAFQNDVYKFVNLQVLDGDLNSSQTRLRLDSGGGFFRFIATEKCVLKITYINVSYVKVSGDQGNALRYIDSGNVITVNVNDNVLIEWGVVFEPYVPIGFIFGMAGFLGMFFGPCYCIYKLKQRDYYEGAINGFLITLIGICLVLAWLWG